MYSEIDADIERHLKSHPKNETVDGSTVSTLEYFLKPTGRIHTQFLRGSTEPNTDGRFELTPDPAKSRRPTANFFVQIKGTDCEIDKNGTVRYYLQDLAFPAYIWKEVTLDPGILFIVVHPSSQREERVFWKYVSNEFLYGIDFKKDGYSILFQPEDELKLTQQSQDDFVARLEEIAEMHSFVKMLEKRRCKREDVLRIITYCDREITAAIESETIGDARDDISRRILTRLEDLCTSVLLFNAIERGYGSPDLRVAWEIAALARDTKFLCTFLRALRYIDRRIPEEGQSARLILGYFDFLWQIRYLLLHKYRMRILPNLNKFPREGDPENEEYLGKVAVAVEKVCRTPNAFHPLCYFVERKKRFYVNDERYFELTLQLAGKYASKYNRLTVYTKEDISTNYSVQIAYCETPLQIWQGESRIKVVTGWKVSIAPTVLNRFGKIFNVPWKLSSRYGEYDALMQFLTETGINLLDLIDLNQERFEQEIGIIYRDVNTVYFRDLLIKLKREFSEQSLKKGRNVIRYLLINLREEEIENVFCGEADTQMLGTPLLLKKECYPFESSPLVYNLPASKLNTRGVSQDVLRAVGMKRLDGKLPYIRLRNHTEATGEIYIPREAIGDCDIAAYNRALSGWDIKNGMTINADDDFAWIASYEETTLGILRRLAVYTQKGNYGQERLNTQFLKEHGEINDEVKREALHKAFVSSRLMMIYGAAGTGKTKLMEYLSELMPGRSKLFVTKTHTALDNLKHRMTSVGRESEFNVIDQIINGNIGTDYDLIFMDECSTIDNRSMLILLSKLNRNSLLICAGDIYQIESIDFGNWFFYAKSLLPERAIVELTNTWRTNEPQLKALWEEVRNSGPLIPAMFVLDGPFSEDIGEQLLESVCEDEVVLCLNYDGRFGLNNINTFFQDANTQHEAYEWHEWKYKVGDRILFNQNRRFPKLYNNLKGKIAGIEKTDSSITFTVEVNEAFTDVDFRNSDLEIVGQEDDKTLLRFTVYENTDDGTAEDGEYASMRAVVPFQLAYAVSIHKAQGLEYDSVKIVIPASNSEKITHGIFYTAITRARRYLKVYWSEETMTKIIGEFGNFSMDSPSLEIVKRKL